MKNVILSVPEKSWDILRKTLELDTRSKAFDRETREVISAALGTVMHIGDDVSQLIDQSDILGHDFRDDADDLPAILRTDFQEKDDDPPWGHDQ